MGKLEPASSQRGSASENSRGMTKQRLAEIYDQNYLPIYRYIYRQVGDVDHSRELSAEVFYRLLRTIQKDPSLEIRLVPWLYRTAHNLVIDHYRKQGHRDHLPLHESFVSSNASTAETAEGNIRADRVREAIQNLTPDQRQVILLKYFEGQSNGEVAEVIGKTTGAVKSLQHRALVALKHLLVTGEEIGVP